MQKKLKIFAFLAYRNVKRQNQFIQIDWIDTEEMEPELESSFEVKY